MNTNEYTGQRSTANAVSATGAGGSTYNRAGASTAGPEGTVFEQLNARDVEYDEAAALFSVTRTGAADVLDRWRDGPESAAMLSRKSGVLWGRR